MRKLRIAVTVACLVLMLVPAVVATIGRHVSEARTPAWFGPRHAVLRRLPDPPAGWNYRFAVMGDIQQGLAAYRASLARLREAQGIAFAVVCGDLVNRKSLPHYRVLFAAMKDEDPGFPVLTVPGNHDDPDLYGKHVGPRFWSARVGPDLVVGVDTSEIDSPGPFFDILSAKLAEDARYRFVFLHRPVARPGRTRAKFAGLARVLADGNVTAVFAGHLHHWESFTHEGVLHVTNGRGGDLTGTTTSDAAVGIVTVTAEGVSAEEVGVG
ncbi:MAG: metallophosphoesterase, partial [Planctomycetota bacterium]